MFSFSVLSSPVAVYHVTVVVNVSHTSLHCREAWGSEPVFSWLHEQAKVDSSLGRLSDDNSTLYVTSPLCGHYTCRVSNKLGYSSGTYVTGKSLRSRWIRSRLCLFHSVSCSL